MGASRCVGCEAMRRDCVRAGDPVPVHGRGAERSRAGAHAVQRGPVRRIDRRGGGREKEDGGGAVGDAHRRARAPRAVPAEERPARPGCRARGSCVAEPTRPCAAGNHRVADWPRRPRCSSTISPARPPRCSRPCCRPRERGCPAAEFDKLLEWWASTLSRVAESQSGTARREAYAAMLSAVRGELERDPLSRPTAYWVVVAARGAGDFDGAWNAAVTGWIRTGAQPEGSSFAATSTASSPRRSSPSGRRPAPASASMRRPHWARFPPSPTSGAPSASSGARRTDTPSHAAFG